MIIVSFLIKDTCISDLDLGEHLVKAYNYIVHILVWNLLIVPWYNSRFIWNAVFRQFKFGSDWW